MKVNLYAVYDAKMQLFEMVVPQNRDDAAIRWFYDVLSNPANKDLPWVAHPEDFSLWCVGVFDKEKGTVETSLPVNLINANAALSIRPKEPQFDLFKENSDKNKEPAIN